MKIREVSLPELTLGERQVEALSIITGVSGSGKSFTAANAKCDGVKVLDLDTISIASNGKWLADVAKIPKDTDVIIGWSDNLGEVAKTLRSFYEDGEHLTMYWIQPSPQIFRDAQAAKAKDVKGEMSEWKQDWTAKARWTDDKIRKYLESKKNLMIAKIKPEELIIVANTDARSPITKGWHERVAKTREESKNAKYDVPQTDEKGGPNAS